MININTKQDKTNEKLAKILGFSGLIPFVIAIVAFSFDVDKIRIVEIIMVYGYTIIAFLGGIYWGVGLNIRIGAKKYFFISILPTIFVLISLLLSLSLILKLIFLQTLILPKWFLFLRIKLNIFLTLLLIIIALSAYLSI